MKGGNKIIFERNVPFTMRDGITLYGDVWRPSENGVYPVLLTRLPYNKEAPAAILAAGPNPMKLVEDGYVVIYQDVRGCYQSEGDWAFESEPDDGYDSVEIAANLPYANGNVGMFGISYLALTQWMAAVQKPPSLKAIFPQQFGYGVRDFIYPGGAFSTGTAIMWAAGQAANNFLRKSSEDLDYIDVATSLHHYLNALPEVYEQKTLESFTHLIELFPEFLEWVEKREDVEFWDKRSFAKHLDSIDIPVYHLGGWFDIYSGATTSLYADLHNRAQKNGKSISQKMVVGPWTHGQLNTDVVGDLYVGVGATANALDLTRMHLDWFDYWLKGVDNNIMSTSPIKIFVMGDNYWRDENEWPLARTEWTKLFLRSSGNAANDLEDGKLVKTPSDDSMPDSFDFDPSHPAPTCGGVNVLQGNAIGAYSGPRLQREIEERDDVLTYTSDELVERVEVTGPISFILHAATSGEDTDWSVKLTDVDGEGRSYVIAEGYMRARYREDLMVPQKLEKDCIYKYSIDMRSTSYVFKKGHRIRVQVSSSSYPFYSINPNTGFDYLENSELVVARQTVFHDQNRQSYINLPIIPNN